MSAPMKYLCTHTHTHTGRGESVCECLCLCLFLHERRPVLCKYTPSTVEGGLRGVGVDGRRTDWLTGPASCLINRQFAKVDTCTARIILGHTWAPFLASAWLWPRPREEQQEQYGSSCSGALLSSLWLYFAVVDFSLMSVSLCVRGWVCA